ncbi:hypothetical protein PoB_003660400 [Plakobranchus ocellatus]|uniref:Uncharacterized protein n=1 Tax=Plakobranchus ocellatus TaxID=259542 RepID=A0AAV4AQM0_9GAST|nr:hypothetical protein PoB_003660400 [Plakobranchus ocellatus]
MARLSTICPALHNLFSHGPSFHYLSSSPQSIQPWPLFPLFVQLSTICSAMARISTICPALHNLFSRLSTFSLAIVQLSTICSADARLSTICLAIVQFSTICSATARLLHSPPNHCADFHYLFIRCPSFHPAVRYMPSHCPALYFLSSYSTICLDIFIALYYLSNHSTICLAIVQLSTICPANPPYIQPLSSS